MLSAASGKGVPEALRALLEMIDSSGGTTAARRRAEAAGLAAVNSVISLGDARGASPCREVRGLNAR